MRAFRWESTAGSPQAASGDLFGLSSTFESPLMIRSDGAAVAVAGLDPHLVGVGPPASLESFRLPVIPFALDFIVWNDLLVLGAPSLAVAGAPSRPLSAGGRQPAMDRARASDPDWRVGHGRSPGCQGFGLDRCDPAEGGRLRSDRPCLRRHGRGALRDRLRQRRSGQPWPDGDVCLRPQCRTPASPCQGRARGISTSHPINTWSFGTTLQIDAKRYWDLCTGKKDFCPNLVGSHLLWRPDSQRHGHAHRPGAADALPTSTTISALVSGVAGAAYAALYAPSRTASPGSRPTMATERRLVCGWRIATAVNRSWSTVEPSVERGFRRTRPRCW